MQQQKEPSERIAAIWSELDQSAQALERAKADHQRAFVKYEAAREKFRLVRQLAVPMMTGLDWAMWQQGHPGVKYAAIDLAAAILEVLRLQAYAASNTVVYKPDNLPKPPEYNPWLGLENITLQLEEGGFDFRTTAPLREVNAALLNMEGRDKHPTKPGEYAIANARLILDFVKGVAERGINQV